MWYTKIILPVVLTAYFVYTTNAQCFTPNGEPASCISLYSCPILYNAITTKNPQQVQFLKKSQCGYTKEPLVCCGSYDNYKIAKSRPTRTTTEGSEENDWSDWGPTNSQRVSTRRPNWNQNEPSGLRQASSSSLPDRATCGFQEVDRILNGQATGLREFPWMALLQYRKKSGTLTFSCGGTLIASQFVLTAAHCVRGQILTKIGPLVTVRLGEYNTNTEEDCSNQLGFQICNDKPLDSGIEKIIVHPEYSDTNVNRYHDIAIIKLSNPTPTTDFIKPICLPTKTEKTNVGDRLVVAGWGRTEFSNTSPVKQKLWVPVASPSQCSSKFRSAGVSVGNKQLCAGGERGKDSCSGDSGGPLMATTKNDSAQWYLEGIVSFGARCGSEGWPGIYTKVSEYIDWIQNNLN